MQAIQVQGDALIWAEAPSPPCGADEVCIAVRASAVNRADLVQRSGGYPPPPGASPILGLECAGEIVDVGGAVTGLQVGQAVCALLAGGGYAERVVVPAAQVMHTLSDNACITCAFSATGRARSVEPMTRRRFIINRPRLASACAPPISPIRTRRPFIPKHVRLSAR